MNPFEQGYVAALHTLRDRFPEGLEAARVKRRDRRLISFEDRDPLHEFGRLRRYFDRFAGYPRTREGFRRDHRTLVERMRAKGPHPYFAKEVPA